MQQILAVLTDVFEPLTNAYVVLSDKGLAVSIAGHPEYSAWLTEAAQDAYPGPAHGGRDAWMANYAAYRLKPTAMMVMDHELEELVPVDPLDLVAANRFDR